MSTYRGREGEGRTKGGVERRNGGEDRRKWERIGREGKEKRKGKGEGMGGVSEENPGGREGKGMDG